MGKKKSVLEKAPWGPKGLMHYPSLIYSYDSQGTWRGQEPEWRDNEPFKAALQIDSSSRGRSAAYFNWRNVSTGDILPMFMTDMVDFLERGEIVQGITRPVWWHVRKRGQNYGIAFVDYIREPIKDAPQA